MAERLDGNEVIGAAESSAQSNTEDVEKFMMFGPFHTRVGQVSKMGQQRGQSRFAHGYLLLADFAPSFPFSRPLSSQLPHLAYVDAIALTFALVFRMTASAFFRTQTLPGST